MNFAKIDDYLRMLSTLDRYLMSNVYDKVIHSEKSYKVNYTFFLMRDRLF